MDAPNDSETMSRALPPDMFTGGIYYSFDLDWKTIPFPNGSLHSPITVVIYQNIPPGQAHSWKEISRICCEQKNGPELLKSCNGHPDLCDWAYLVTAWVGSEQLPLNSIDGDVQHIIHITWKYPSPISGITGEPLDHALNLKIGAVYRPPPH